MSTDQLQHRRRDSPEPVALKQAMGRASSLVGGIARDTREIIDTYLELAKLDLREEISQIKSSVVVSAVSVAVVGAAAMLLLVGVCLGLAAWLGIPAWATFGAVGALGLMVGAVTTLVARQRARRIEKPLVIDEGKEDLEWLTEQT